MRHEAQRIQAHGGHHVGLAEAIRVSQLPGLSDQGLHPLQRHNAIALWFPAFLASELLADVPSGGRCAESLEEGYLEVVGHEYSVHQL